MTRSRKVKRYVLWALFPLLLSCASLAQSPQQPGMFQQKIQQMLQQAIAKNEQQLHSYQWMETTSVTADGRQMPPKQSLCRYGSNGAVLKTPLQSQEAAPASGGPLKRRVMEKKKEEFQEEAAQVHELVGMYLPPNHTRLEEALRTHRVDLEHGANGNAIVVHDYVKPGDQLMLTVDFPAMQIRSIAVSTYFDNPVDALTADVQFSTLPDGTAYPSVTSINAPSKNLSITTVSTDFSKLAY